MRLSAVRRFRAHIHGDRGACPVAQFRASPPVGACLVRHTGIRTRNRPVMSRLICQLIYGRETYSTDDCDRPFYQLGSASRRDTANYNHHANKSRL